MSLRMCLGKGGCLVNGPPQQPPAPLEYSLSPPPPLLLLKQTPPLRWQPLPLWWAPCLWNGTWLMLLLLLWHVAITFGDSPLSLQMHCNFFSSWAVLYLVVRALAEGWKNSCNASARSADRLQRWWTTESSCTSCIRETRLLLCTLDKASSLNMCLAFRVRSIDSFGFAQWRNAVYLQSASLSSSIPPCHQSMTVLPVAYLVTSWLPCYQLDHLVTNLITLLPSWSPCYCLITVWLPWTRQSALPREPWGMHPALLAYPDHPARSGCHHLMIHYWCRLTSPAACTIKTYI